MPFQTNDRRGNEDGEGRSWAWKVSDLIRRRGVVDLQKLLPEIGWQGVRFWGWSKMQLREKEDDKNKNDIFYKKNIWILGKENDSYELCNYFFQSFFHVV